jgi:hypothetical protein
MFLKRWLAGFDNGWSARSWAVLRALLGGYLAVHFAGLLPWAAEVFSAAGMATATHSPLFAWVPSPLWLSTAPEWVILWTGTGLMASVALALGVRDRWAAGVAWWVLATLFAANPLIANPSLPHVGWMLVAHTLIPSAPSVFALWRDPDAGADWRLPPAVFAAGWAVMALAYAYSGWTKLAGPSWLDGTALLEVLGNPLARPTALRTALLGWPGFLMAATWFALALELLAPVVALTRRGRLGLWWALLALQVGLLVLVDFADLTWGMLVLSAWTFDPAWLTAGGGSSPARSGRAECDTRDGCWQPSWPVRPRQTTSLRSPGRAPTGSGSSGSPAS